MARKRTASTGGARTSRANSRTSAASDSHSTVIHLTEDSAPGPLSAHLQPGARSVRFRNSCSENVDVEFNSKRSGVVKVGRYSRDFSVPKKNGSYPFKCHLTGATGFVVLGVAESVEEEDEDVFLDAKDSFSATPAPARTATILRGSRDSAAKLEPVTAAAAESAASSDFTFGEFERRPRVPKNFTFGTFDELVPRAQSADELWVFKRNKSSSSSSRRRTNNTNNVESKRAESSSPNSSSNLSSPSAKSAPKPEEIWMDGERRADLEAAKEFLSGSFA